MLPTLVFLGFPCGSAGEVSICNAGDLGSIPGLGRSPGEGKGYSLQYSGLENSLNCIVHGVAKSRPWLRDFHFQVLYFTNKANKVHKDCCCGCLVTKLCLTLFVTPMDYGLPGSSVCWISRQEYWSWWPFPFPGDLPNPGIKPTSPAWQVDFLPLSHQGNLCRFKSLL